MRQGGERSVTASHAAIYLFCCLHCWFGSAFCYQFVLLLQLYSGESLIHIQKISYPLCSFEDFTLLVYCEQGRLQAAGGPKFSSGLLLTLAGAENYEIKQ